MFHRRYRITICPIWMFIALITIPGCMSHDEKVRVNMRRRMGEIPDKYKNDGAPQVGDTAYLFKLKTVAGDRDIDISSFAGKKPVALFFGSYT